MVLRNRVPSSLIRKALMESLAVIFGKRVRLLREDRNWTQEELSKASGLGPKHIGVIERGEKTSSFDAVERIAKALSVDYYELFVPLSRRTGAVKKEIEDLLVDPKRIDTGSIEEFLKGLRIALRKLDRGNGGI